MSKENIFTASESRLIRVKEGTGTGNIQEQVVDLGYISRFNLLRLKTNWLSEHQRRTFTTLKAHRRQTLRFHNRLVREQARFRPSSTVHSQFQRQLLGREAQLQKASVLRLLRKHGTTHFAQHRQQLLTPADINSTSSFTTVQTS